MSRQSGPGRLKRGLAAMLVVSMLGGSGSLGAQQESVPSDPRLEKWQDPATADSELMPLAVKAVALGATNSRDRAIVVGERGHILISESRRNWRQVQAPTRSTLTAVAAVDNHVWAVGHDQVVLHSRDGGLSWERQNVDVQATGPLLDVIFLDAQRGFAIGAYGQFLKTSDGGANWSHHVISEFSDEDDRPAAANATRDDEFGDLASDDIGEEEGDPHLNGVARLADGSLVIVGERGAYYVSRDEGESWQRKDFDYEGSMFGIVAPDDGSAVAFGLRGNAFVSTDGAVSWSRLNTGTELSLLGGTTLPGGRVAIVGANGMVLLKPPGSLEVRRYTYAEGGVLAAILPIGDAEFVLGGENGLVMYEPSTGRAEEAAR